MSSVSSRSVLIGLCTAAEERDLMHLDQAKGNVTAFADLARDASIATEYLVHFGLNDIESDKEKLEELIWLKKQGRYCKVVIFAAGSDRTAKYFRALFNPYDVSADDVTVIFSTADSPRNIIESVWRPDLLTLSESCVSDQDRATLDGKGIRPIYYPGVPHNLTDHRLATEAEKAKKLWQYDPIVTENTVMIVVPDCSEAKRIPPSFIARAARSSGPLDVVVMSESRGRHDGTAVPPDQADAEMLARYVKALGQFEGIASASGYVCTDDENRLPPFVHKIKATGGHAKIVVSGILETAATILSAHCPHVVVTMHPMMDVFERGAMTALWRSGWIDVQDENGKVTPRAVRYPGAEHTATHLIARAAMTLLGLSARSVSR